MFLLSRIASSDRIVGNAVSSYEDVAQDMYLVRPPTDRACPGKTGQIGNKGGDVGS